MLFLRMTFLYWIIKQLCVLCLFVWPLRMGICGRKIPQQCRVRLRASEREMLLPAHSGNLCLDSFSFHSTCLNWLQEWLNSRSLYLPLPPSLSTDSHSDLISSFSHLCISLSSADPSNGGLCLTDVCSCIGVTVWILIHLIESNLLSPFTKRFVHWFIQWPFLQVTLLFQSKWQMCFVFYN